MTHEFWIIFVGIFRFFLYWNKKHVKGRLLKMFSTRVCLRFSLNWFFVFCLPLFDVHKTITWFWVLARVALTRSRQCHFLHLRIFLGIVYTIVMVLSRLNSSLLVMWKHSLIGWLQAVCQPWTQLEKINCTQFRIQFI